MHLWNDYEGQTMAGLFPLEKLLRTEGRSGFFATRDSAGKPAVLRLTEALNDQQQIFARYRAIKGSGHNTLVKIEAFGETEWDGTPLIYLVLEATQESLADILSERRLSTEETHEVAHSVVSAIESLHANGLVHGLVEPVSVLAAGEVIKLRSDCARPAPEGEEGTRARAEDVLGVADVLHRSLTQQRLYGASDALALPEPYASIVRNCWRGSWGIEEVAAELRRAVKRPVVAVPEPVILYPATPVSAGPVAASAANPGVGSAEAAEVLAAGAGGAIVGAGVIEDAPAARVSGPRDGAEPVIHSTNGSSGGAIPVAGPTFAETLAAAHTAADAAAPREVGHEEAGHAESPRPLSSRGNLETPGKGARGGRSSAAPPSAAPLPADAKEDPQLPLLYAAGEEGGTLPVESRWRKPESEEMNPVAWVAAAVGVLLLVLLVWHFAGASRKTQAVQHKAVATSSTATPTPAPVTPAAAPNPVTPVAPPYTSPPPAPRAQPHVAGQRPHAAAKPVAEVWRVVAYTYKQESQAQAKARVIAQKHAGLHPQVYSRNGRAPYLVTLGGGMTKQQAVGMRQKAKAQGLARDVYVQNYSH